MPPPSPERRHPGFALPLALLALVALALLVALLLDAGVQELRIARGDMAQVRAEAIAASALADLLASAPDTALVRAPRGTRNQTTLAVGSDTATVELQSLGGSLVRAVLSARGWQGSVRGDARSIAFLRLVADSGAPRGSALRLRRVPGWWWAPLP